MLGEDLVLYVADAKLSDGGLQLRAVFEMMSNPAQHRHELALLGRQIGLEKEAQGGVGGEESGVKEIGTGVEMWSEALKAFTEPRRGAHIDDHAGKVEVRAKWMR